MVCAMTSKQGLRDRGPLWPKPEIRVTIRRGFSSFSVSQCETHLFQGARHEILDQHIGFAQQAPEKVFPLIRAQIEGQAALVAVEDHRVEALAFDEGTERAAVLAAARRFHLDDVRPHVAQQHGAVRARYEARQVHDADAIQCPRGGRCLCCHQPDCALTCKFPGNVCTMVVLVLFMMIGDCTR